MYMSTAPETKNYTITETAKISGLPESTLRYYETIGLIDPIKRDANTKRRIYSEDDVNGVVALACLSAIGLSIEDMRQYLSNRENGINGAKSQVNLLSDQTDYIKDEIHFMQLRLQYVENKVDYWKAIAQGDDKKAKSIGEKVYAIADAMKLPKTTVRR